MLHSSRIFSALLVFFLLAVAFFEVQPLQIDLHIAPYLIVSVSIVCVFLWKVKALRYLLLASLFILISIWRVGDITPKYNPGWINYYIGKETKAEFRVIEEPKVSGKSQQIVVRPNGSVKGNIQITTAQFPEYHFGDTIIVSGKIEDLSKDSELYRGYFKAQQIYVFMNYPEVKLIEKKYPLRENWYFLARKPLINLRLRYEAIISKIIPEPQAGLLSGILLGSKSNLSTELLSWLSVTGTIHIIALSGYNITIIADFLRILTRNLSRRLSFWVPVLGIIFFVLATGLSSSVVRAAIMGSLLLLAKKVGRQSDAFVSVLFASSVMVFVNPHILLYDVGFQLSFAAVCGILFLAPKIEKYFSMFGNMLGQILAATFAAQMFSWPVTSYYFGIVSIISPISNLLILPVVPYLMLIGFVASTIGFASLWLAKTIGLISWVLLSYCIKSVQFLSGTSWAARNLKISSGYFLLGYYLLLADLIMVISRRKKFGKTETI